MFRNELLPVDRLRGEQPAHAGGVKQLGGNPVVIELPPLPPGPRSPPGSGTAPW
jgi:hypothetical protein